VIGGEVHQRQLFFVLLAYFVVAAFYFFNPHGSNSPQLAALRKTQSSSWNTPLLGAGMVYYTI
jgi:hypothetical protein